MSAGARLTTLTPREADIFLAVCDTAVAPEPPLPPVRDTHAVAFLDAWLARAPAANRYGLRAALHAVELAPLRTRGIHRRLRQLDRDRREAVMDAAERGPLAQAAVVLRSMAQLAYYADDAVMRRFGYDADAVVARGRELRAREGRW